MEILQKVNNFDSVEDVKNCCINILTEFCEYSFCFIDFETENFLGVYCTRSDLTEGFVLISKKYIVSISMVYEQDIVFEKPNTNAYM